MGMEEKKPRSSTSLMKKLIADQKNAIDDKRPIAMLNLLKYKGEEGKKHYNSYLQKAGPYVKEVGAKVIFMGKGEDVLIGNSTDNWDTLLLVRYPSRKAFVNMISSKEYKELMILREKGLEDSILMMTN